MNNHESTTMLEVTSDAKGIRHSSLPKLAKCPCYEFNPHAGPAAARGTLLDAAFRELLETGNVPIDGEISCADIAAVHWAVATLREKTCGAELLSQEAHCKVQTPGMAHIGTADAIAPSLLLIADLKTGQIRNYREQMAAYALGLMEMHFAERWTCELLFCDQKQVVTHQFTYEEAREIVDSVLQKASDPERKPEPCEYCSWCVKAQTCEARREAAATALSVVVPDTTEQEASLRPFAFEDVLNDPACLGRFLSACKVLDDFREKAEERARELLENSGAAVPGWRLRRGGAIELVFADDLARLVLEGHLSLAGALGAHGTLGARKFRELWEKETDGKPLPEEVVRRSGNRKGSLVQG